MNRSFNIINIECSEKLIYHVKIDTNIYLLHGLHLTKLVKRQLKQNLLKQK